VTASSAMVTSFADAKKGRTLGRWRSFLPHAAALALCGCFSKMLITGGQNSVTFAAFWQTPRTCINLRGASADGQLGAICSQDKSTFSAKQCMVSAALVACGILRLASRKRPGHSASALSALSERAAGASDGDKVKRSAVSPVAEQLVTSVSPQDGPQGTYQVGIDFGRWLQSCTEELSVKTLRVEGSIPAWLKGSLVHAGPAKFEFGDDEFVDWVDGQAMLYKVCINGDGTCEYQNKWVDTWNHRQHREAGRIAVRETCSRPSLDSMWDRFIHMFSPPNNENGNLHISHMVGGARPVTMSVGSSILEFKADGLETLGKVPFDDELVEGGPLIFHAEPHTDPVTGEWYTCAVQLRINGDEPGMKPEYVVFSVKPTESREPGAVVKRNLITRIKTEHPAPIHTIGLTSKYLVLLQTPYPLNWNGMIRAETTWLMTGHYEGNLSDYNLWEPERPTLVRLIDRETGEHTAVFETDPFFFFHIVNAFEEKDADGESDLVQVDVVAYNEPPVGFPLRQARSGDVQDWRGEGGEVRRLTLNLATGECSTTGWPDNCFDEPKISPKVDGARHKYSYGVVDYHGQLRLVKLDHDTKDVIYWEEQDVSRELPWQPVFVPEPYSEREDAGVLMSFVRDQPTGDSYCLLLDTTTFKEQARIYFPENHHIPLHGHGMFMQGEC